MISLKPYRECITYSSTFLGVGCSVFFLQFCISEDKLVVCMAVKEEGSEMERGGGGGGGG